MTENREDLVFMRKIFREDMGLCGCGNPEDAYLLVRDILDLAPFYNHWERVVALTGNSGSHHIALSALDRAGLIVHGGGIGGSWLTDKGSRALAILRTVTDWERFSDQLDDLDISMTGEDRENAQT